MATTEINLIKNKVVRYDEQNLTNEEKGQARNNIGAAEYNFIYAAYNPTDVDPCPMLIEDATNNNCVTFLLEDDKGEDNECYLKFPLKDGTLAVEERQAALYNNGICLWDNYYAKLGTLTNDITINCSTTGVMWFGVEFGATMPTITWANASTLHGLSNIILEANHGYKIRIWDGVVEIISAWEA